MPKNDGNAEVKLPYSEVTNNVFISRKEYFMSEKLKLKDGTLLDLVGAEKYSLSIVATPQTYANVLSKLTKDNLSAFQILNANGAVTTHDGNKEIVMPCHVYDTYTVFDLKDVDILAQKVAVLEAQVAALQKQAV